MGKAYESSRSVEDFVNFHRRLLPEIVRITKPGGSICWQVGFHSLKGHLVPLDYIIYGLLVALPGVSFKNRIIWSFAHGLHRKKSFSGRHETVLWFTKGNSYNFDLDAVRTPQKYPGKKFYKGPRKGEYSGNPLGKNPGDVWDDIPNVKGHHVEKLEHPCQFPVALPQRIIRAVCGEDALVFDPFMGVGSTGVAAVLEGKRFIGSEIHQPYVDIASTRLAAAVKGLVKVRPLGQPIFQPIEGQAVSTRPSHFKAQSWLPRKNRK
jgi:adenine-specific DNA-methyltransferase